jgi:hypothetical protein
MTTRAAACVREIVAERNSWTGSAADFLQAGAGHSSTDWPKILARSLAVRPGHRDYVQSRRPSWKQVDQDACNSGKYGLHRQQCQRPWTSGQDNLRRDRPVNVCDDTSCPDFAGRCAIHSRRRC